MTLFFPVGVRSAQHRRVLTPALVAAGEAPPDLDPRRAGTIRTTSLELERLAGTEWGLDDADGDLEDCQ